MGDRRPMAAAKRAAVTPSKSNPAIKVKLDATGGPAYRGSVRHQPVHCYHADARVDSS